MKTRELPIYGAIYTYTREIYRIKTKLPKSLKHDLGQEIFHSAVRLLKLIAIANRAHEKGKYIREAILEIEAQWVFARLLLDLKGISEGEFKAISQRLYDIGKQAQSWLNWDQRRGVQPAQTAPKPKPST